MRRDREDLLISLNLPGRHNVLNACAAIAVAEEIGLSSHAIAAALKEIQGVGRRMQVLGEWRLKEGGEVLLVDDYGHHPREIAATLAALQGAWPERRLVMVFQPHRYTRTRDLYEDFVSVLSEVACLCLMEVYARAKRRSGRR